METRKNRLVIWTLLLSFMLFFMVSFEVQAADFIKWTGYVMAINAPSSEGMVNGPTAGPMLMPRLGGADISLVSNPSVSAKSSSDSATLGKFVLPGIPSNQMHWIKVKKTGFIPTNIGVNFGDTDIVSCDPLQPAPNCFGEQLFAVNDGMKNAISSGQFGFAMDIDPAKGILVFDIESTDGSNVLCNMQTGECSDPLIILNGGDSPLTPDQYLQIEHGRRFLIPNIPSGDISIALEVSGLTIPAISVPVFAGEISFGSIETLNTQSTGTVTGKVTKEDGTTPIAGAKVNAMPDGFGRGASTTTGADGTYTLKLTQGMYRIQAESEGYAPQLYYQTDRWDWAVPVMVTAQMTTTNIDFMLSQAYSISGTVMAGTVPVANAWVNAWSDSMFTGSGAQTDSNGSYTINVKPATDYKVNVSKEGYAMQYYDGKNGWNEADFVDVSGGSVTGINFNLATGKRISGKVTLADGTTPVPYVWVNAWSDSSGSGGGANTKEDGTYEMTVAPASDYRVSVYTPGYPQAFWGGRDAQGGPVTATSWDAAVFVDVTQNDEFNIDIKLSSGNTISGTVKLSDGTALANININAFSFSGWGNTQTDTNGAFTISVPPGPGYRVEAFSDDYPRVMWNCDADPWNKTTGSTAGTPGGTTATQFKDTDTCTKHSTTTDWMVATEIDTSGGNVSGLQLVMAAGITVAGTVKTSSGDPVQGAWVNAWSDTAMTWGGGNTDGKGSYSFKVPPADGYKININHPEYPMAFYSGTSDGATDSVTVDWNKATVFNFSTNGASGIDFVLSATSIGSISGTVKAKGRPVSAVWINAWSEECSYGVGEPTKADGTYIIKVQAGCKYKVEAFQEKYIRQFYNGKFDWLEADLVNVPADDTTTTSIDESKVTGIDFTLSAGNSISGKVTVSGAGLAGIWVNAWSETGMSGGGMETDSAGNYTIYLKPAADYKVGVWHPDYTPQMYNNKSDWMQADPVDISKGSVTDINFALNTGNEIRGTVLADGQPPAADNYGNRGWVNAWSEETGSGGGAPVKNDGTYMIKVSPASDYRVQVWHPNYANQFYNNTARWDAATLVDASSGSVDNINFNLTSGRTISGTITDDSGAAKQGIWVNAWSEDTWSGAGEPTDANGNYLIKGLEAGTGYRVSIWSPDYANVFYKSDTLTGTADWNQASLVDLTSANATGINIKLSQGGNVTGKVKVTSGTLSGNIWVDAFSESMMIGRGEPANYTEGASEVTYLIKGLPPASDYKVHVWAENYGNKFYENTSDWNLATKVTVTGGQTTTLNDITLSTGASISGTVYKDSVSPSNVLRSGWVQAMNPTAGEYQGTPISPDGTYSIKGLTAGNQYTVQAMPFDYIPMFYTPTGSTANWVDPNVTATETGTTGIDIVVSQGHTISGKVLDTDGTTTVPYAFIGIFKVLDANSDGKEDTADDIDDNEFLWSPMSDAAGNYVTPPLPDGKYLIGAHKEGKGKGLYRADKNQNPNAGNIELTISGSDLNGKDISFKAVSGNEPGSISGTVTTNTARDEIQVILYNADTGKVIASTSKTNIAQGGSTTYTFDKVKPGNYKVKFLGLSSTGNPPPLPSTVWYNGKDSKTNADPVTVAAGQAVTAIDATLQ